MEILTSKSEQSCDEVNHVAVFCFGGKTWETKES